MTVLSFHIFFLVVVFFPRDDLICVFGTRANTGAVRVEENFAVGSPFDSVVSVLAKNSKYKCDTPTVVEVVGRCYGCSNFFSIAIVLTTSESDAPALTRVRVEVTL